MTVFGKLIILLLLFFVAPQEERRIVWEDGERLSWEDFNATPDASSPFVASTQSGISFGYNFSASNGKKILETDVKANFYPDMSWYRPEKANTHVLSHEQGHFDITEIHARILRKTLAGFKPGSDVKEKLEAAYHRVEKERKTMQRRYDKETDHSRNKEEETRWQKKIAEQLEALDAWKE